MIGLERLQCVMALGQALWLWVLASLHQSDLWYRGRIFIGLSRPAFLTNRAHGIATDARGIFILLCRIRCGSLQKMQDRQTDPQRVAPDRCCDQNSRNRCVRHSRTLRGISRVELVSKLLQPGLVMDASWTSLGSWEHIFPRTSNMNTVVWPVEPICCRRRSAFASNGSVHP